MAVALAPAVEREAVDDELALLAKALAHPARVQILRLLLDRDACFCGEIVERLPLAQATVSQHLKVLSDAGLIRGEIEGPRVYYCANLAPLERARDLIAVLAAGASGDCECP